MSLSREEVEKKRGYRQVVVKFREGGHLTLIDGQLKAPHLTFDAFYEVLKSIKYLRLGQFLSNDEKTRSLILSLQEKAKKIDESIEGFDLFIYVDLPIEGDYNEFLTKLRKIKEIDYAYLGAIPAPPIIPINPFQGAGFPGWMAVNANHAWGLGISGKGVNVCDAEYGFRVNHPDLPNIQVVRNMLTPPSDTDHGTSVLGILFAIHNGIGCDGICPNSGKYFSSEDFTDPSHIGNLTNRTDAIQTAVKFLSPGDVLLLEMQSYGTISNKMVPVENEPACFNLMQIYTTTGTVIIEPAGNDLDKNPTGSKIERPWSSPRNRFKDSGAIMVGACVYPGDVASPPNSKLDTSNYGSRVDCHAWGENIFTTSSRGNGYTQGFGMTSGASAIIAGAAACLQEAWKKKNNTPLSSTEMRKIFRDPNNGTHQTSTIKYPDLNYRIGPLPNLKTIFTNYSL